MDCSESVDLLRTFNRGQVFNSAAAQDTIPIFQNSTETNLPVRFASMADSKDKGRVLNNGVNNPMVADSEFPKTCEFACEGWEVVCPIRQLFFDFS